MADVYAKFDKHEDGIIKPFVVPDYILLGGTGVATTTTTTTTV